MPQFQYTGKNSKGETVKGSMEADSRNEVAVTLRRQNVFPTQIVNEAQLGREIKLTRTKKKITVKDLSIFCNQFATIIRAGISLIECLDILRKQSENQTLKEILDQMFEDVQKGVPLSKSMAKHPKAFPKLLINMVESGELSGQLDLIMQRMADHYDKEFKLNMKIRQAMVYPIILVSVSILVTVFLLIFVLPNFVNMFDDFDIPLPLFTQILLGTGEFMAQFWYIILLGSIGIIFMFMRFLNTAEGRLKFDDFKLHVPLIGPVNRKIATSRFSRNLSTMISSGISIIDSMELVSRVIGNVRISEGIDGALDQIKKGEGIAAPLSKIGMFPPMMISMIRIGEDTGNLESLLETTADFYDQEVEIAIQSLIQLINPAILFVMALVVGGIVMAIALPMFEMYQHMSF
ncbi:type II secretion system F family protein [Fusibacter sp. JL216-2]|uniref:type II secretion system F family protein n=1 Tax=Fusibacter sp. JL216-2 TaxID=3071453 RepID=UPI003D33DEE1